MKTLIVGVLLFLPSMLLGQEWEKIECTICGKAIYQQVVGNDVYDSTSSAFTITTSMSGVGDPGPKEQATWIPFNRYLLVCSACKMAYRVRLQSAMKAYIDGMVAEIRRKELRSELSGVEQQISQLQERAETLRAAMADKK